MSGSVNKAIIVGNLGQDPESRQVGDTMVCNFTVATSKKFNDRDGNPKEKTEWHRISVWGRQAEACVRYLSKGKKVFVEGEIETRKWQDKDGNDRYTTEIRAKQVTFLSPKDQGSSPQQSGYGGTPHGGGDPGGGW